MKKPNTLPELLRHAADLAEKGEPLKGKFEYNSLDGWHAWDSNYDRVPSFRGEWRIADQDKHLLDDGWIRHTGDTCPVHRNTVVSLRNKASSFCHTIAGNYFSWRSVTHYKIIKEYIEPTTFEMKVGDKVFVLNKPYMSAPESGYQYWYVTCFGNVKASPWYEFKTDGAFLCSYNCWKTEADAKAYAEAKLARDNFEIGKIK
jgi:hypothetical protein